MLIRFFHLNAFIQYFSQTNKKPMKRIVVLIFHYLITKINAQEYFPNNESVQNKNNNFTVYNAKILLKKELCLFRMGKLQ
jgi:hypothetical protein